MLRKATAKSIQGEKHSDGPDTQESEGPCGKGGGSQSQHAVSRVKVDTGHTTQGGPKAWGFLLRSKVRNHPKLPPL